MSAPPAAPILHETTSVTTADGVSLATDVYRPAASARSPRPAVLLRTYLGRRAHAAEGAGWARRGFACAVQDVRGRFDSGGTWDPYSSTEAADGERGLDWLADRPWCDGRVVLVGGSYASFCAFAAADHPAVAAVVSSVPAHRPVHWIGGVPPLLAHVHWWLLHGHAAEPRVEAARELLARAADALDHWPLEALPPDSLRSALPVDLPDAFRHLLAGPDEPLPLAASYLARLDVPVLHVGGWYDVFLRTTLDQWRVVGSEADSEGGVPRPTRGLWIGPWTHELRAHEPARYGEREHGPASRFDLGGHQVRWLRKVIDGKTSDPAVRVFELGADRWIEGSSWPPVATRTERFFAAGSGRLAECVEARSAAREFVDDPADPFPSRLTPLDERRLAPREDRVVFETAALGRPLRVFGTPRAVLWVEAETAEIDWFVRLLEITADGRILHLVHGLVDAGRELRRHAAPGESVPGPREPHRLEIPLDPRAITIPAGHRLRLEITGSFYPSYARNPGTGADRCRATSFRAVRRRVLHGGDTATFLELPVAREDAA